MALVHAGSECGELLAVRGEPAGEVIGSGSCQLMDLLARPYEISDGDRQVLDLGEDWPSRWVTTWKVGGADVACPVRDMGSLPVAGCEPVRRFSWRTTQRHRPGLQFLVGTGRHHGFESIAEQRLLLAVDFLGGLAGVLSQPHRMRFLAVSGPMQHTPDFLIVTGAGTWLIDVRPAGQIEEADRIKFAASAEAALACGWRYLVVTGWRPHVMTTLDTLASQRRVLTDPLGAQPELLAAAADGPVPFGELAAATRCPAVARAHALHLIWHRRLVIDLAGPLTDETPVRHGAARADR